MEIGVNQSLYISALLTFFAGILMHLMRRNSRLITVYALQSTAVTLMLLIPAFLHSELTIYLLAVITFLVKVVLAPFLFFKFINRKELQLSVSTYLSLPMTLGTILLLTFLAKSDIFMPLILLNFNTQELLYLPIASILVSLFLIINRKGAISQVIGILSFENSVVAFSSLIGLEQTPALEFGIIFDIFLWIVIATVFISLIYNQFKSLDVTQLRELRD